jgi:fucose permease
MELSTTFSLPIQASLLRARCSVSTIFFINGMVLASWVPHIPTVKAYHAISDGQLGIVLLFMAVGSLLALPVAGGFISRFGSRMMTTVAALSFCLMLPLPIFSPNVPMLALSLLFLGAGNGLLDVSMNAQAVDVERQYHRTIMSSFHGLFSLGGLVGAAFASQAMALGASERQHVILITILAVAVVTGMLPWLLPSPPHPGDRGPTFVRPSGMLLSLGMLAFFGLLAEGAMADWSAVYLHDVLKSDPATAALGFAACSMLMAVGRFSGDFLVMRVGPSLLLRLSSLLAALGLGSGLLIGTPFAAIVGFGLVGLGIANIIPILFSAAGRLHLVQSGNALAAVATTGYFGFLAGPPLIGLVAEVTNLSLALGLVSVFCVFIAASAHIVLPTK